MSRRGPQYEERRQQIIAGALQVFAEKGFDRATNRDIAAAAHIASPGLIYHYFRDKQDLLHEVIRSRIAPLWQLVASSNDSERPLEEVLFAYAHTMAAVLGDEHNLPVWRILLAEAARDPRVAALVSAAGPGYTLRSLADYLERQMAADRLRRIEPTTAALLFFGPIIAYTAIRHIYEQAETQAISPDAMAHATATAFLAALAPTPLSESPLGAPAPF